MMMRMTIRRPTLDIIRPAIALPLPPASFLVKPIIEKISPNIAGSVLKSGSHEIHTFTMPRIRPAVAAPLTLFLLSIGVIITGCVYTG